MNPSIIVNSIHMQISWLKSQGMEPNNITLGSRVFHQLLPEQLVGHTLFGHTLFGLPIRVDMFDQDVVAVGVEFHLEGIIKEVTND